MQKTFLTTYNCKIRENLVISIFVSCPCLMDRPTSVFIIFSATCTVSFLLSPCYKIFMYIASAVILKDVMYIKVV